MSATHERLLSHPVPVDKTAALHIAGGNRTGREELLWAQREAFDRAMTEARLLNMAEQQHRRREFARAAQRLDTLKPGTFYRKDWKKHTNKMRSNVGVAEQNDERMRRRITERLHP